MEFWTKLHHEHMYYVPLCVMIVRRCFTALTITGRQICLQHVVSKSTCGARKGLNQYVLSRGEPTPSTALNSIQLKY